MGVTIENLAESKINHKSIFNNRFVIEICEKVHVHYRNLRIVHQLDDFINIAESYVNALERWKKRGCPGTGKNQHIELCRKQVAIADDSNKVVVNLNDNLYKKNEGGIFSEGADFKEDKYIHIKLRDIRYECSIEEFNQICDTFKAAQEKLNVIA